MRFEEAFLILLEQDRQGRYVYAKRDLVKLFDEASENTFNQCLRRLVTRGVLIHAARDVYVFAQSANIGGTTIEQIAATLRRGEYTYESLESALSQWGSISQIPIDRITFMTTGRRGEFVTPYGIIEFTHTNRQPVEIIANTVSRPGHCLPIATEVFALQNIKDVGRNLSIIVRNG
ncbi:MAG: hypothetical protein LBU61_01145 [Coriobacteriales bacterium]|jgi:hypothetical protein|nr:hypothetical protein [Coriobacteriales bacterium]